MKKVYKLIYNPHSGKKRRFFGRNRQVALEEIKRLFDQYQIDVDYFPTKYPNHATKLAKEAVKEGYMGVIVAGGDGTIGEVANGLIESHISLGIIPLGSFMNVARMLAIPQELEKAVALIKIGRKRKIDMGIVIEMGGKSLDQPYFFLESVGVGLWAQLHQTVDEVEKGKWEGFIHFVSTCFGYYHHPATLSIDATSVSTKAVLITVSNGPYSAAALKLAPDAKLNDHLLTISLYKMTKFELLKYFYYLFRFGKSFRS